MTNNSSGSVEGAYGRVWDFVGEVKSAYETTRQGVETYARAHLSPKNGEIASKVSKAVSEILIDLCVLTGVLRIPAFCVFVVLRAIPISKFAIKCVKKESTKVSREIAWEQMKKEYADTLHDKMGPALIVALAVDALVKLTWGLLALKAALLIPTAVISVPACYLIYEVLTQNIRSKPPQLETQLLVAVPAEQPQNTPAIQPQAEQQAQ